MLKKLNKIRKEVIPSLIPAILPSLSTFAVINASVFSGYIAAQNATIEEVVVTARKKSESLQDVPLSVNALKKKLWRREESMYLKTISLNSWCNSWWLRPWAKHYLY